MTFKNKYNKHTYPPSDDSLLMVDTINKQKKRWNHALDMGTGTGIIAYHLSKKTNKVTAIDINPHAIKSAQKNLKNIKNIEIKQSDLFSQIKQTKYDLITFNPPYIPIEKPELKNSEIEKAWNGGKTGRKTINKFITQSKNHLTKNGSILLLTSSITNPKKIKNKAKKQGFKTKTINKKEIFFETLEIIQLTQNS
ncbi:Methylase of polypeptide chain release factors HemK [Methanonatronarchaeum thermophilum]|uniref:Methylase of polypeptide chain release factors HemK n=1 Tax=Methanonatronarchaeum thermophilum TaxID=1927129 RepID=A0A1Y3GIW8_9EURY|nr:HemK2/MTQ2 family protein methyltransferase [Methanonatronarchaeum thermophilum]OUJ19385.1 Methylase of polypeptide chain release factors HemK [Methanonatronarchaeum thermophilum]